MRRVVGMVGASVAAAGALAVAVWGGGAAVADAELQSSLVEDFAYPGADQILAEHGVRVHHGDGHIEFVPAESGTCRSDLIRVETEEGVWPDSVLGVYCFRTSGARGFLTMEVPGTFLIKAAAVPVEATAVYTEDDTVDADDTREVYKVGANKTVSVDVDQADETSVLVELRFGTW